MPQVAPPLRGILQLCNGWSGGSVASTNSEFMVYWVKYKIACPKWSFPLRSCPCRVHRFVRGSQMLLYFFKFGGSFSKSEVINFLQCDVAASVSNRSAVTTDCCRFPVRWDRKLSRQTHHCLHIDQARIEFCLSTSELDWRWCGKFYPLLVFNEPWRRCAVWLEMAGCERNR